MLRPQQGVGSERTFLDFLCRNSTGGVGGGERTTVNLRQRLGAGGGQAGEWVTWPLLFLVGQAEAHTHTRPVCTRAHTGLKSWHIPGS